MFVELVDVVVVVISSMTTYLGDKHARDKFRNKNQEARPPKNLFLHFSEKCKWKSVDKYQQKRERIVLLPSACTDELVQKSRLAKSGRATQVESLYQEKNCVAK